MYVRRAFERLGRIESLQPSLDTAANAEVSSLVSLAQQELKKADAKNAADLLRAAEHLGFAALAATHSTKQLKLSSSILSGIEEEYEHLSHKAAEHWDDDGDRHPIVKSLYKDCSQRAKRAFAERNYRQALELIRTAEALAHVIKSGPDELTAGREPLSLTGSEK